WLVRCMLPSTLLFQIYSEQPVGVVMLEQITLPVGAVLHYATWAEVSPIDKRKALNEILSFSFEQLKLERLTFPVPWLNQVARRQALSIGAKYEGSIRHAWLKNGEFYDLEIYGLLK